ncbi:MAG: NAD(P)-dependent oxidoreductase [Myxococcota bacterium]
MSDRPLLLMTGCSGLIGTAVAQRLASTYRIVGFDQKVPAPHQDIEFFHVDMASDESVSVAMAQVRRRFGTKIASTIHLADHHDFSGEPSELYEKVTVRGTERLLRALRDMQVEQFVFSSTMLVHAPCRPGQQINEDWPLEPKWIYPRSKLETERVILSGHQDLPVVILRIAGVYDDRCHSVPIAHQMQRIYERRVTAQVFPGDTATGQAFVHLDDLVELMRLTVMARSRLGPETIMLVGEPETLSYDELQRIFAWLIHEEHWETRHIPKAVAKAGAWVQDVIPGVDEPFIKPWMVDLADDHYELAITRARKLLGWEPKRTLRETLPKMVEFLRVNPAGFYRQNRLEGAPPEPTVPMATPYVTTTSGPRPPPSGAASPSAPAAPPPTPR